MGSERLSTSLLTIFAYPESYPPVVILAKEVQCSLGEEGGEDLALLCGLRQEGTK